MKLKNLESKIIYACEKFDERVEFEWRVLDIFNRLDSKDIGDLILLCSKDIPQPKYIKYSIDDFMKFRVVSWKGLFQYVIFEIIFQFKEKAIPVLVENIRSQNRIIAGNSIMVLCKIASQGIKTNFILKEIDKYQSEPNKNTYPLLHQWLFPIKENPIVDKIYDEIIYKRIKEESSLIDVAYIYNSIYCWSKSNPLKAKKYLLYLKEVLNGKPDKYFEEELEIWSPIEVEEKLEFIKINVAIVFLKIEKDEEVIQQLYSWMKNSKFEKNRKRIQEWKESDFFER